MKNYKKYIYDLIVKKYKLIVYCISKKEINLHDLRDIKAEMCLECFWLFQLCEHKIYNFSSTLYNFANNLYRNINKIRTNQEIVY